MQQLTNVDMRKGVCPKCGATDIRWKNRGGWGGNLNTGFLKIARVDKFVCVSCGYLEEYVIRADRKKIADSWDPVPTTGPG
jgi:predicted nucleic-acid-binding Zn-ribbon protein